MEWNKPKAKFRDVRAWVAVPVGESGVIPDIFVLCPICRPTAVKEVMQCRGVTGKFSEGGGNVTFPYFLPA